MSRRDSLPAAVLIMVAIALLVGVAGLMFEGVPTP